MPPYFPSLWPARAALVFLLFGPGCPPLWRSGAYPGSGVLPLAFQALLYTPSGSSVRTPCVSSFPVYFLARLDQEYARASPRGESQLAHLLRKSLAL
jgi:hypothetical protein